VAGVAPHPPGRYPVVVIGSGAGGLQVSYFLSRRGIAHALLSADDGPGGMFRRFPLLQRLITWSKPYAPADPASPEFERYDWNSLLVEGDDRPIRSSDFLTGPTYFPARAEMEANLAAFADRFAVQTRYGCRWEGTERGEDAFRLQTSDGEYEAEAVIFAVGAAEPWRPDVPGMEHAVHYADIGDIQRFRGRRVLIAGKRNGAFELADGLLPVATQLMLVSPRPANLSVITATTAGARARYLQVYEDAVLGGGTFVIDAALDRIERTADGFVVSCQGTTVPGPMTFSVDDVIAATGWSVPMGDLPALGVAVFHQARLPAQTPYWESPTVPGVYFAGTASQGSVGLKKYGIPSTSAAVHGFRYNARVLVDHIAERRFGWAPPRPAVPPDALARAITDEMARSPALWNQKAYLARVFEAVADGVVDAGLAPLQAFVDSGGPDAVAATVETTDAGEIRPVLYVRRRGSVEEHPLLPHPLQDFGGPEYEQEVAMLLKGLLS